GTRIRLPRARDRYRRVRGRSHRLHGVPFPEDRVPRDRCARRVAGDQRTASRGHQRDLLRRRIAIRPGSLDRRRGRDVQGSPVLGRVPRAAGQAASDIAANTTLSLVVTNQQLDHLQLRSIGRQVHASMARAIQPFHARWDGDVSYMVSTQDVANADLDEVTLGELASDAMWEAVLAS